MARPVWLERLKEAPDQPGVYFFRDITGRYLYIGKARSLQKRLEAYRRPADSKTRTLHREAVLLDWVVTASESDALLLEAQLIRNHQPLLNVRLKTSNTYTYIFLDTREAFPRIEILRKPREGLLFGPYPSWKALRETLYLLRQAFPIRTCTLKLPSRRPYAPCLDYHLGLCSAPCAGLVSREAYGEMVRGFVDVLQGRTRELEEHFEREIEKAKEKLAFEYAARLRDRLMALRKIMRFQEGGMIPYARVDHVVVAEVEGHWGAMLFKYGGGRMDKEGIFLFDHLKEDTLEASVGTILEQIYAGRLDLPQEVVIRPLPSPDERLLLEQAFGFALREPGKEEASLYRVGMETLLFEFRLLLEKRKRPPRSVRELQKVLDLPRPPYRMEAVDLSHIFGREAVGSVVVFERGFPKKSEYRRYRIKQAPGGDDFRGMFEVVHRRLRRLLEEGKPLPELLLIDGGVPQVRAARQAARNLGIPDEDLPIVGLAKRLERLMFETGEVVVLPPTSPALQLLQRIRNEAHRFARTYHISRRDRWVKESVLDGIPGVGEKRKQLLLRYFGSVEALRGASVEDLQRVPGIGPELARTIHAALHEGE